jgi:hypothetical protein
MGAGTDLRTPSFFAVRIAGAPRTVAVALARVAAAGTRNGVNRLFVGGQYSLQSKDAATWPT